MSSCSIALAETDTDITRCFPVMLQLRPHLIEANFVDRIRRMQKESYQLAFLADPGGTVRSVAGFRRMEMLHSGNTLYVDDLVAGGSDRSQGYGGILFDWLVDYARAAGCDEFHLDSGVQRFDAHRFYLRKRMAIEAHHFGLKLK